MRWLGCIFILISTTWTSMEISRSFIKRQVQLRSFIHALQILESEITYGQTPLDSASSRISNRIDPPISWIFEEFSDQLQKSSNHTSIIWEQSLNRYWKWTALKEQDRTILVQFGESLGQYGLHHEKGHIHLTLTYLKNQEKEANEQSAKYVKLIRNIGLLGGILLIIVLF
jgi:stage III sporulation protein AB